ncbi:MAG: winged helix-turn-helix transcriptional regulator [Candidatus Heimdallarchaeota archaeon]|nr:winged helix-turn-helix transcriptional regulator [Candidatus Heimdallarchaeota archaeon]
MSNENEDSKIAKWLVIQNEKQPKQRYLQEANNLIKEIQAQEAFMMELKHYSALGNEIRYTILKLLEQKPLCTCVLAKLFDLKEATISHHLKILESAGLLIGIKKGPFIIYHTKKTALEILNM